MSRFTGKVVVLTGASSGIGEALARELASQGADLALLARREDRVRQLAEEIRALGRRSIALPCDVTREEDMKAAASAVRGEWGKIDIVIANAGFGVAGKLERLSLDDYRRQFETNVYGVIRTIQATLEDLKRSKGSAVIVGSVSSHIGLAGNSAYTMSKFAVRGLAQSLTHELAPHGVAVTLICPGFVESEIRQVDNRGVHRPAAKDPVPSWLVVPTQQAARSIAKSIAKRKRETIITTHGKLIVFLQRHFPGLVHRLIGLGVKARPEPTV